MPIDDDIALVLWDDEDDPDGNVQHIARHGVTPEEAADVLHHPLREFDSDATGLPIRAGYTAAGRRLYVVFEWIDAEAGIVDVITAYEPA